MGRGIDDKDTDSTRIGHGYDVGSTRIGRGLAADSTRIRRGFDADSTRNRGGSDADSTRIRRGLWIAYKLQYSNQTRIGRGLQKRKLFIDERRSRGVRS